MFTFTNSHKEQVSFLIHEKGVKINRKQNSQEIPFSDIVGGFIRPDQIGPLFEMDFIYCKISHKKFGKFQTPTLEARDYIFLPLRSETKKTLEDFRFQLLQNFYKVDSNGFKMKTNPTTGEYYYKKIMVVINPNSGKKKGEQIYKNIYNLLIANGNWVNSLFSIKAGYVYEQFDTLSAEELISYDVFVCISGDGTPFEVINSYFSRKDIDHLLHPMTIQIVPAGSGCALVENTTKMNKREHSIENAVYSIFHVKKHQHFLQNYQTIIEGGIKQEYWGFLNCNYGFFADVDIESESMRYLGGARFDVYGFFKYFVMKKYDVEIYYPKNYQSQLPPIEEPIKIGEEFELIKEEIYSFYSSALEFMAKDYNSSPALNNNKGFFDVQIYPTKLGKYKFLKYLLRHQEYKTPNSIGLNEFLTREFRLVFSQKPNFFPNVVLDGETLKEKKVFAIQAKITEEFVYFLI